MKKYQDMIYMKRPKITNRISMSMRDRAFQFAPFSVLKGHKEALDETARQVDKKIELDEYEKNMIAKKLSDIIYMISERPEIKVSYFIKDLTKEGGFYITETKVLVKFKEIENILIFKDNKKIHIDDIFKIDCTKIDEYYD